MDDKSYIYIYIYKYKKKIYNKNNRKKVVMDDKSYIYIYKYKKKVYNIQEWWKKSTNFKIEVNPIYSN